MRLLLVILLLLSSLPALADTVVPTRTIRAHAIIEAEDVALKNLQAPQGFARLADVIGQEARVVLYPGRAILISDIGPPALVTRNQIVRLAYAGQGIEITTEGRALERGALGDHIRIMNLASRATIIGQVRADGTIAVSR